MQPDTHHLIVPRTARYLTAGSLDDHLSDVWFLSHGYGQLASEFLMQASALTGEGRLLVVPEALSRFYLEDHERVGASWMTREERLVEMDDYVRYFDLLCDRIFELVSRSSVSVRVLGFSQGAATAARWVARGKVRVDQLILWGAALPPELDDEVSLAPIRATKIVVVCGTRDRFVGETERSEHRKRLQEHGIGFEELTFEGGHRLDDETLRAISSRKVR